MDEQTAFAKLDNGVSIVAIARASSPWIGIGVRVSGGSGMDPVETPGLAHLTEHLLFRGSLGVADGQYSAMIGELGGQHGASTGFDRMVLSTRLPATALERGLWLEAERLATCAAHLTQRRITAEAAAIRLEQMERSQGEQLHGWLRVALKAALPPAHPHRHEPLGDPDSLAVVGMQKVKKFMIDCLAPRNLLVAIVGGPSTSHTIDAAARYFGEIPSPDGPDPITHSIVEVLPGASLRILEHGPALPIAAVRVLVLLPPSGSSEFTPSHAACLMLERLLRRSGIGRTSVDVRPIVGGNSLATVSVTAVAQDPHTIVDKIMGAAGSVARGEFSEADRSSVIANERRQRAIALTDIREFAIAVTEQQASGGRVSSDFSAFLSTDSSAIARAADAWLTPGRMTTVISPSWAR